MVSNRCTSTPTCSFRIHLSFARHFATRMDEFCTNSIAAFDFGWTRAHALTCSSAETKRAPCALWRLPSPGPKQQFAESPLEREALRPRRKGCAFLWEWVAPVTSEIDSTCPGKPTKATALRERCPGGFRHEPSMHEWLLSGTSRDLLDTDEHPLGA